MSRIVGIDLGTTNSAIAYMGENGPTLIPNALGSNLTPSVVAIDDQGRVLVGAEAKEYRVMYPDSAASVFKRHMGTDWTTKIAGRELKPEELSSLILRSLKADAESFLKEPVTRAVITVPAYFNDRQRKATIAAGKIAGFEVERIINEPTAAAIAYGFHETKEDKTILIIDLGGGTFDVSLVDLFDGALEVKASSGESILGGEDFTRTLAARLLERAGISFERAEMSSPLQVSRMLQLSESAKQKLTREESVVVRIPDAKGELPADAMEITVTRSQFETWIEPILARVELPIRRVLGDGRVKKEDVTEVVLVGGATRTPLLFDRVARMLGKVPHRRLNPDEVVAMGAAVQAGLFAQDASLEDMVVTDVSPFTLGIAISKKMGSEMRDGYFMPIIQRNTTIPVSKSDLVATLYPNQTMIILRVFQGESRRVEDNHQLGELEVKGIPPGPAGQEVEVRFTYDLNGVLEVEAEIVATKTKVSTVITKATKGNLSKEEIQRALEEMKKLKMHPREDSVNRYLLKRAERLYQELPTDLREVLGMLLDGFEEALGTQDPFAIENNRTALEQFLNLYDKDFSPPDEGDSSNPPDNQTK
ncbi:MAG: Hsp70 family protein [Zavarzinella sp.]